MRRQGSLAHRFLAAAALASLTILSLTPFQPARADSNFTASLAIHGLNPHPALCTTSVVVCGRQLNPMAVEVGGGFTVRIDGHFRSTSECDLINGQPTWTPISVEGTCEAVPIVTLPASYDEDDASTVG